MSIPKDDRSKPFTDYSSFQDKDHFTHVFGFKGQLMDLFGNKRFKVLQRGLIKLIQSLIFSSEFTKEFHFENVI